MSYGAHGNVESLHRRREKTRSDDGFAWHREFLRTITVSSRMEASPLAESQATRLPLQLLISCIVSGLRYMRVNAAVRRDRSRFKQITSTNVGRAANYWYGRKKNDAPTAIAPAAIASGAARRKYPDRRSQSRSEKRRAKIGYYPRET